MTKRERMLQLLNENDKTIRLGSFWHHFTEDKWFGNQAVDAHLNFYREANLDFIKIMEEIRYTFDMKSAKDWYHFQPVARKAPERICQQDIIKKIADTIGDESMVYTTIFDPLRTVGITMGYDYIEAHIQEDPKAVGSAFLAMAESASEYAEDCIMAGADGIFFSSKGSEKDRFSKEVFDQIVYQPDAMIGKNIFEKSKYTLLHICGIDTELSYYQDFPCSIVNWDSHHGRYDLSNGALMFPNKVILGGIDNHSGPLIDGTDEEIIRAVEDIFNGFSAPNPLILGADCTLPIDISYRRVKTAIESLH